MQECLISGGQTTKKMEENVNENVRRDFIEFSWPLLFVDDILCIRLKLGEIFILSVFTTTHEQLES